MATAETTAVAITEMGLREKEVVERAMEAAATAVSAAAAFAEAASRVARVVAVVAAVAMKVASREREAGMAVATATPKEVCVAATEAAVVPLVAVAMAGMACSDPRNPCSRDPKAID